MDSIRDFDAGVSNNCNIFMNSVDFIDQGIENDDDIEIPVSHQENLLVFLFYETFAICTQYRRG